MARQRQRDVRSLVVLLALLVAGWSSGSHILSRHPQGVLALPTANPHTTLRAAPRRSPAPISARVVLPSRTMTAGSSMSGRVVAENDTGQSIRVPGCLTLFQVALASSKHHPAVAWPTCTQVFTIPIGKSSYPATVEASYSACSPGRPQGGLREHACPPGTRPRSLPVTTTPRSSDSAISSQSRRQSRSV
jgi:hypothetical protein